jgi:two-component system invasion response regulator UvrY
MKGSSSTPSTTSDQNSQPQGSLTAFQAVARVLIADDHPVVREGLKSLVRQHDDLEIVGESEDAESTLKMCQQVCPDLVLLDVSMPGPGILETIRRLRAQRPATRILVLSIHHERYFARRVLKAGADGYVMKSYTPEVLYSAIHRIRSGHKYVSESLAASLADELVSDRSGVPHERLSTREYDVFLRLGCGRRVDEIARQLRIKPKTVRTYRARILEKTGLKSTAEIIYYAVSCGLVNDVSDMAARDEDTEASHPHELTPRTKRRRKDRS